MKVKFIIAVAILFSYGTAKITHYSGSMSVSQAIDLDSNKIEEVFESGDMSEYEFALFGQGMLWMNPDGRIYTFFRNSYVVNDPLTNVDSEFNIADTTMFTDATDKVQMRRLLNDDYIGGDSTGLIYTTEEIPVIQDIDTSQYFLIKNNQSNYCLFRISKYLTYFNSSFLEFDLDSIRVEYWVQDDGSLNFIDFNKSTPIALKTKLNSTKPAIAVKGNIVDCSSVQGIVNIAIYSINGKMMLTEANLSDGKVSVANFAKGQYYLKVSTGDNIHIHKLILR